MPTRSKRWNYHFYPFDENLTSTLEIAEWEGSSFTLHLEELFPTMVFYCTKNFLRKALISFICSLKSLNSPETFHFTVFPTLYFCTTKFNHFDPFIPPKQLIIMSSSPWLLRKFHPPTEHLLFCCLMIHEEIKHRDGEGPTAHKWSWGIHCPWVPTGRIPQEEWLEDVRALQRQKSLDGEDKSLHWWKALLPQEPLARCLPCVQLRTCGSWAVVPWRPI